MAKFDFFSGLDILVEIFLPFKKTSNPELTEKVDDGTNKAWLDWFGFV